MKKIILFPLSLALLLIGCDAESPMDKDLYPQSVYIVGAKDKIVNRDVNIGNDQDTISISVAVSGSRDSQQDLIVSIAEDPNAIETYNTKELSAQAVHYRKLANGIYQYPLENLSIKAGTVYNTYPIYIKPASLHCDSLYMIPLKIKSTSAYTLNKTDTIALVKINLVNKYSGLYYMNGVLKNTTNAKDSLVYKMARNAVATDNGKTIRIYHYNNEYISGDVKDNRPAFALKITINADNTLTFATWDKFPIINGGGNYLPELKLYNFWYTYTNNGVVWRASGFLYKERKTDEEQRIVDNWMEEHPKL